MDKKFLIQIGVYILIAIIIFSIVKGVLKKLGLVETEEQKKAKEDLSKLYQNKTGLKEPLTVNEEKKIKKFAKDIHSFTHTFLGYSLLESQLRFDQVLNVFKQLTSKRELNFLISIYSNEYKTDLFAMLDKPYDGLKLEKIYNVIEDLK